MLLLFPALLHIFVTKVYLAHADVFTVEEAIEQLGFGPFQILITIFSGMLWVNYCKIIPFRYSNAFCNLLQDLNPDHLVLNVHVRLSNINFQLERYKFQFITAFTYVVFHGCVKSGTIYSTSAAQ